MGRFGGGFWGARPQDRRLGGFEHFVGFLYGGCRRLGRFLGRSTGGCGDCRRRCDGFLCECVRGELFDGDDDLGRGIVGRVVRGYRAGLFDRDGFLGRALLLDCAARGELVRMRRASSIGILT